MSGIVTLTDADLHGLVDGHIDPTRRIAVLSRLASAHADRARLEAWQEQTDLLRAAFTGVEREPIPTGLDLAPKARLQCVPDEPAIRLQPVVPETRSHAFAWVACFVGITAMAVGVLWFVSSSRPRDVGVAAGSIDDTLQMRAKSALAETAMTAVALPTTTIPDLAAAGFVLVGAESKATEPASLLFRYRNAAAERVVISVARALPAASSQPEGVGDVVLWHSHANAFAIAGTIKRERLQAIAAALQVDDLE